MTCASESEALEQVSTRLGDGTAAQPSSVAHDDQARDAAAHR